jgi:pyruvate dehydrogenase E2 component (dihydrolipoamide acetyltransferase)
VSASTAALLDVAMPRLSDSMEEATVLRWLKRPGDAITKGEPLVEVETDKATVVYEAETEGVLEEIVVAEGESAALGDPIARIRTDGAAGTASPPRPEERPLVSQSHEVTLPAAKAGRARATPVARRLAGQLGVGLGALDGSGPNGRIVAADVRAAAGAVGAPPGEPPGSPGPPPLVRWRGQAAAPPGEEALVTQSHELGRGPATEVPHTPTQRTIAQRMAESRASIPEFTLEAEIRMDAAAALRDELQAEGREPLPSFNDLVVRATALALRDFPALNASFAPGQTIRHGRINIGIAVDVEDALLVPTIRDADQRSVFELAAESRRLAERARVRSLAPEDVADGTFTVSNLGMFGVRRFHAVINPPQVAILTVGEVALRPAAEPSGELVAKRTMEVALSCDHRVVYGAEAARFLQRLGHLLEHPVLLMLP